MNIDIIAVGKIKEKFFRDAIEEYSKRLSGFCNVVEVNIKEAKLPNDPSDGDIKRALAEEAGLAAARAKESRGRPAIRSRTSSSPPPTPTASAKCSSSACRAKRWR